MIASKPSPLRSAGTLLCLLLPLATTGIAAATEVGLVGLFPGKAILVVDGAAPKAYAIGSMLSADTKLVAADRDSATIAINGKSYQLQIGQSEHRATASARTSVILQQNEHGHFIAAATVNGVALTMMVDTGASFVTLPAADAKRMGINYRSGKRSYSNTANGVVSTYLVKLDSIKIADMELHQIDAAVIETGLTTPLLGMSLLNRLDMRREGEQMTLTKRF